MTSNADFWGAVAAPAWGAAAASGAVCAWAWAWACASGVGGCVVTS